MSIYGCSNRPTATTCAYLCKVEHLTDVLQCGEHTVLHDAFHVLVARERNVEPEQVVGQVHAQVQHRNAQAALQNADLLRATGGPAKQKG